MERNGVAQEGTNRTGQDRTGWILVSMKDGGCVLLAAACKNFTLRVLEVVSDTGRKTMISHAELATVTKNFLCQGFVLFCFDWF